jgi:hypothetical protein
MNLMLRTGMFAIALLLYMHAPAAVLLQDQLLPYSNGAQVSMGSALLAADGSARLAGRADAALDINLGADGSLSQVTHTRAPYVSGYGFPGAVEIQRIGDSQVQFDYLFDVEDGETFDSGCRVRVAPPSRIDFYSAGCGQLNAYGENSYLWFRAIGTSSRLIRRENGVELWNLNLRTIPGFGTFKGAAAVFHAQFAYVYGRLDATEAMVLITVNDSGQILRVSTLDTPQNSQFAHVAFDQSLGKIAVWLREPTQTARLHLFSLDGAIARSSIALTDDVLDFFGANAIKRYAAIAGIRYENGMTGAVLWSQAGIIVEGSLSQSFCSDRTYVYLGQIDSDLARVTKIRRSDGLLSYQKSLANAPGELKLFCDQGEVLLSENKIDEYSYPLRLTRLDALGDVRWQRDFPQIAREPNGLSMQSNSVGEILVSLVPQQSGWFSPTWLRLDANANLRFGIPPTPEVRYFTSMRLNEDGSMLRLLVTDGEQFFEKRSLSGAVVWQTPSPYGSMMRMAQTPRGSVWFASHLGDMASGLHLYALNDQGQATEFRVPGLYLRELSRVGSRLEGIIPGAKTHILQLMDNMKAQTTGIPGEWSENTIIAPSGDVFGLLSAQQQLQKYHRDRAQLEWTVPVAARYGTALVADDLGGVWMRSAQGGTIHVNTTGQVLTSPQSSQSILLAEQQCNISEIVSTAGGSAIGYGYLAQNISGQPRGCVFWLDPRGIVYDGVVVDGSVISVTPALEAGTLNALVRRDNIFRLAEARLMTLRREQFLGGFE